MNSCLDPWAEVPQASPDTTIEVLIPITPSNQWTTKVLRVFVKPWGSGSQVSPCKDGHICFLYSNSSRCKRTKRLRVSDAQSSGRHRKSQNFANFENRPPQQQNNLQALASAHLRGFHLDGFLLLRKKSQLLLLWLPVSVSFVWCPCFVVVAVVAGVVLASLWGFICDYQDEWTSHKFEGLLQNLTSTTLQTDSI